MESQYKSDDTDDLLEGIITSKHQPKKDEKPLGPVDAMVQQEVEKAKAEEAKQPKKEVKREEPVNQEQEWAKLMKEPDPL